MRNADKIRLIAFDVDGTLTPGMITYGPEGEICKEFNVHDGLAIALLRGLGFRTGLITGRKSSAAEARGRELHVDFIRTGVSDKAAALQKILDEYGISWEETAFMGDDLNDLSILLRCGLSAVPADGCAENREKADFVSSLEGGHGAAREFIETLLREQGRWGEVVSQFTGHQD